VDGLGHGWLLDPGPLRGGAPQWLPEPDRALEQHRQRHGLGHPIDGYYKVIGEAGSSGGDWAPHLHARVNYGESLTGNGQPYGGETVKPLRLRCFNCNNPDVAVDSGGGYYNDFFRDRWMMY
jgi:hypothetical protein